MRNALKYFRTSAISYADWLKFLELFAEMKGLSLDDLKERLVECGLPGTQNETKEATAGGQSRVDVSKFAH